MKPRTMNNLPPGVLPSDTEGPPMPRCKLCSDEHNDDTNDGLCPPCHEVKELVEKIAATCVSGCPWCGSQPIIQAMKYRNAGSVFGHKIRCDTCNFERSITPPCWGEGEEQAVMDAAKSQLVEWWNTRKI